MSQTTSGSPTAAAEEAAARLLEANRSKVPCAPVRELLRPGDVDQAYEVQALLRRRYLSEGRRPVGHKIGLTSPSVQQQLGVDQPDSGVIFADMRFSPGDRLPMSRLIQPKAEAEVAFVLGRNIDDVPPTIEGVRDAVAYAVAALEVVDSRIAGWDIGIVDTVADNASSGLFVLGDEAVELTDLDLKDMSMRLTLNGVEGSSGTGAACMGNPLNALRWLVETSLRLGHRLRRGDIVLSGALGPMVDIGPGAEVSVELEGFEPIAVAFEEGA